MKSTTLLEEEKIPFCMLSFLVSIFDLNIQNQLKKGPFCFNLLKLTWRINRQTAIKLLFYIKLAGAPGVAREKKCVWKIRQKEIVRVKFSIF